MFRAVVAVFAGYAVMAVWVMLTLTVAWLALGRSFAIVEGTTDVTPGWIVLTLALSGIGAILGGFVAALIGRSPTNRPVKVLAGITLVLGLLVAGAQLAAPPPAEEGETPAPPSDARAMTFLDAGAEAKQPLWYSFTVPVVGFVGILLGGALRRPAKPAA